MWGEHLHRTDEPPDHGRRVQGLASGPWNPPPAPACRRSTGSNPQPWQARGFADPRGRTRRRPHWPSRHTPTRSVPVRFPQQSMLRRRAPYGSPALQSVPVLLYTGPAWLVSGPPSRNPWWSLAPPRPRRCSPDIRPARMAPGACTSRRVLDRCHSNPWPTATRRALLPGRRPGGSPGRRGWRRTRPG